MKNKIKMTAITMLLLSTSAWAFNIGGVNINKNGVNTQSTSSGTRSSPGTASANSTERPRDNTDYGAKLKFQIRNHMREKFEYDLSGERFHKQKLADIVNHVQAKYGAPTMKSDKAMWLFHPKGDTRGSCIRLSYSQTNDYVFEDFRSAWCKNFADEGIPQKEI